MVISASLMGKQNTKEDVVKTTYIFNEIVMFRFVLGYQSKGTVLPKNISKPSIFVVLIHCLFSFIASRNRQCQRLTIWEFINKHQTFKRYEQG